MQGDNLLSNIRTHNTYFLSIKALKKSYRDPEGRLTSVVSVAEFSMEAGLQAGIRGESGSGKTTFLNLIAGIMKPDAGSLRLDGVELTELSEGKRDRLRATTLGCVYQTFNLLQGYTCLENVMLAMALGAGRDRAFAVTLLERVGLGHRLHFYPRQLSAGLETALGFAC